MEVGRCSFVLDARKHFQFNVRKGLGRAHLSKVTGASAAMEFLPDFSIKAYSLDGLVYRGCSSSCVEKQGLLYWIWWQIPILWGKGAAWISFHRAEEMKAAQEQTGNP